MSEKAEELGELLKQQWAPYHKGRCYILSKGDACGCHLCLIDDLTAMAKEAERIPLYLDGGRVIDLPNGNVAMADEHFQAICGKGKELEGQVRELEDRRTNAKDETCDHLPCPDYTGSMCFGCLKGRSMLPPTAPADDGEPSMACYEYEGVLFGESVSDAEKVVILQNMRKECQASFAEKEERLKDALELAKKWCDELAEKDKRITREENQNHELSLEIIKQDKRIEGLTEANKRNCANALKAICDLSNKRREVEESRGKLGFVGHVCEHVYEEDSHGVEMIKSPLGKVWAVGGTDTKDRWTHDPWCGGRIVGVTERPATLSDCLSHMKKGMEVEEPEAPLIRIRRESGTGPECPECGSDFPRRYWIAGARHCVNPSCKLHKDAIEITLKGHRPDTDIVNDGYGVKAHYHKEALEMFEKCTYGKMTDRTKAMLKILASYGGRSYQEIETAYRTLGSLDETVACVDLACSANRRLVDYANEAARRKAGGCIGQPDCKCNQCIYDAGKNIGVISEGVRAGRIIEKLQARIAEKEPPILKAMRKLMAKEVALREAKKRIKELEENLANECLVVQSYRNCTTTLKAELREARALVGDRDAEIVLLNQMLDASEGLDSSVNIFKNRKAGRFDWEANAKHHQGEHGRLAIECKEQAEEIARLQEIQCLGCQGTSDTLRATRAVVVERNKQIEQLEFTLSIANKKVLTGRGNDACNATVIERLEARLEMAERVVGGVKALEPILVKARKKFQEAVEMVRLNHKGVAAELEVETVVLVDALLAASKEYEEGREALKSRALTAELVYERPLDSTETPEGQKYPIGATVRLTKDWGWPYKKGDVLVVQYSYRQKYGWMCASGGSVDEYSCTGEHGSAAWFHESILELVSEEGEEG